MNYKFEWIDNNPIVTFEGDISFDDIFHIDGKIYGDSRFDLIKYIIYNFLEVKNLNLSALEMKAISYIDKSASRGNEKIKFAIVIQDNLIKKVILDYMTLMLDSSWEIEYFNTVDKALDWCKK